MSVEASLRKEEPVPGAEGTEDRARSRDLSPQETTGSPHFSHHEIGAILESHQDPAIVISSSRRILAVNRRYAAIFGQAPGKIVGRHCYQVSHRYPKPCDQMGESCPVQGCLANGQPCRTVHVHHTPRGPEHEEIVTYPVTGRGGRVSSFLEVIRPFPAAAAQPSRRRMVGRSPAFNATLELARKVARKTTPVLLLGETGTGKELMAHAVHEMSTRAAGPVVPVDCSGISESLVESELFGHERGAFTGADRRQLGLVESAAGGTLFLDEVGDIPLSQQVKLLRLLENGVFRRVGRPDLIKAEFRLVCATHRDLNAMVAEGTFRSDLYYRLSAFPIVLPTLRERRGDLPLLAASMLKQVGCSPSKCLDPTTLTALEAGDFPGNVRQLRNVLERACMLADGDLILPQHLPAEYRGTPTDSPAELTGGQVLPLAEVESRYLRWALDSFAGDNRELARLLGLSERTFYRKVGELRQQAD